MSHPERFLATISRIASEMNPHIINDMAAKLSHVRANGGRLFIIGIGGSAANASHAVNDFRKLCDIESYAPTDNVSELTARTNDEGWETVFETWLRTSALNEDDAVLVMSVGGGSMERGVSVPIVNAVDYAKQQRALILGIVGRDGGHTKQVADICIVIPTIEDDLVTPLAEAFQSVVWHALVSHPLLAERHGKWESIS